MSMRKALCAITAMFIGGLLYISSRSESLTMFRWFALMGLREEVNAFRVVSRPYLSLLPGWIRFSLPQALWYFSGLLSFDCIWGATPSNCWKYRAWLTMFSGLAVGMELGQYFRWVPGQFDIVDLTMLMVAWSAASIISSIDRRTVNEGFLAQGVRYAKTSGIFVVICLLGTTLDR